MTSSKGWSPAGTGRTRSTWWVESARRCTRVTKTKVECDFQVIDWGDVDENGYAFGCEDRLAVRETRTHYLFPTPYSEDCGYHYAE